MLERKQIQRLLDIAFLGCQHGHVGASRLIVNGLDQILESSSELEICRAMSFYTVDQFEEARVILTAAQEKFPENQMIKTHMALVDLLTDNGMEAREALDQVIAENKDADATKLARELIAQYC